MIRVSQNNDWVLFILLGCIFLYILMFVSLKRDSTVREFLTQELNDSSNSFLCWITIGLVFCLVSSTLVSQYVAVLPDKLKQLSLFGYSLNKFGFSFLALGLFLSLRTGLSYVLWSGTAARKRWRAYYFAASKFYFISSVLVMGLCFVRYYTAVNEVQLFDLIVHSAAILFIFKLLYYLLHPVEILPSKWYYKLLYICTLQIMPVIVLFKVLFF